MITYCFEKLKLHQLYANIASDNLVSLQLFNRAGFTVIGNKKDWLSRSGQWQDELLLQLINNR